MTVSAADLWSLWTHRRDAAAFDALVRPELSHALGFARRLGCSEADAEDALQDALIELARTEDDGPIRQGLRAWLCRVVRTRARSRLRSERRRRSREARASAFEVRAPGPSRASLAEEVESALAELDPDEREAVTLRYVHDLEYRDVALVLGVREPACRQRVHRAVDRLRGRLGAGAPALLAALSLPALARASELVREAAATSASAGPVTIAAGAAGGVLMASTTAKLLLVVAVFAAVGIGAWSWTLGADASRPGSPPGLSAPEARSVGGSDPADARSGVPDGARPADEGALLHGRRIARDGQGALVGRVLDARTTKGASTAAVRLSGTSLAGGVVDASTETAADGTFRFAHVAAGLTYTLRVTATGLAAFEQRGIVVTSDDVSNVGDLWLGLASALAGIVVDPDGTGVAGVDVSLYRGGVSQRNDLRTGGLVETFLNIERAPEPLARTTTTAGGSFRIASATTGPATLVVRAPGYQQATRHVTLSGVTDGALERVELAPGSTLAGRVIDTAGAPVSGVRLVAYAADGGLPSPVERAVAESSADGTFRFPSLAGHGRFALIGTAPGRPSTFQHANAGDLDVRVLMRRGAVLDVRIVDDSTGTPLVGAQVLVAVGDTYRLDDGPGSLIGGLTDTSGSALLEAFPGELQLAIVNAPGYPPNYWDAAGRSAASGHGLRGPSETHVGPDMTTVTFRVPAGVALRGRVTDPEGAPLEGVEVSAPGFLGVGETTLSAADGSYRLFLVAGDFGLGVTARRPGWVQMPSVAGASSENGGHGSETLELRMRRATTLVGRVVDREGHPIPGARVKVRAESTPRRFAFEPLTQHEGRLPGDHPNSIAGRDGRYAVDGVAPGGRVRVFARHDDFVEAWTEVFEVDDSVDAPDVRLLEGAGLEVRVVGPNDEGVAAARVRAEVERAGEVREEDLESAIGDAGAGADRRTDAGGVARLAMLPPGRVTVRVTARGYAPAGVHLTVAVEGARTEPVTIRLSRGTVASGRVVDADGRPVEGAQVVVTRRATGADAPPAGERSEPLAEPELWSNDWDRARRATTDSLGRWSVADLPVTRFDAQASKDGYRGDAVPLDASGAAPELRLVRLPPEVAARIAAIDREQQRLYGRMSLEGETEALVNQLVKVREERQRLFDGVK